MTFTIDFNTPYFWIVALWFFYMGFAAAISVYRLWIQKKLNLLNETLYSPLLITFFLTDVVLNWTVLLILGIPPKGCITMSDRFQVYHLDKNLDGSDYAATSLQKAIGTFICVKLLNPIDPTGNHC